MHRKASAGNRSGDRFVVFILFWVNAKWKRPERSDVLFLPSRDEEGDCSTEDEERVGRGFGDGDDGECAGAGIK